MIFIHVILEKNMSEQNNIITIKGNCDTKNVIAKTFNLDKNNNRDSLEEFLKTILNNEYPSDMENNIVYSVQQLLSYYISDIQNNDCFIKNIIKLILDSKLINRNKIIIFNTILTNKNVIRNYKINTLSVILNELENPEKINNNLMPYLSEIKQSKLLLLATEKLNIVGDNYSEEYLHDIEQQEIEIFLSIEKDIIKNNFSLINNNIKSLENIEQNIVSHITDTHGDSLSILGSLKQTGFIGELTGEILFFNIKNKTFTKLKELEISSLGNIDNIRKNFVIIPDFTLPNVIPSGIFVHTGDIQDRGQESAESFVILRRTIDLYKEKYMKDGFNEKIARKQSINKIIITTSDHDIYSNSKYNESLLLERPNNCFKTAKNKFDKNFKKHHRIQEDMFKDGYINSGRLVQTKIENFKILANHSYVDANSVALVLMAIIFPYNNEIYRTIDKNINLDYISKLHDKCKKIKKYQDSNVIKKIKSNIIKTVLKQNVDLNNIDEMTLDIACKKFFRDCFGAYKMDLNIFFTSLRYCMGIGAETDNFVNKINLTATEILEAFSIGTKVIDKVNREKMKNKKNKHYEDPIIDLITFRNGRTFRGDGFLDSTIELRAAPIKDLLKEGILILNGHDAIQNTYNNSNIESERNTIANYPNDRNVSYFYNEGKYTVVAPQIFKISNNGKIKNGIYSPLLIERGNFGSKNYCEPNPNAKTINNISVIEISKINDTLGAGTEENDVGIVPILNIAMATETLEQELFGIQNQLEQMEF